MSQSQYGYVLGVPSGDGSEWSGGYCCLQNEELDIDPHFAYFGCNTESEVIHYNIFLSC
jgi:hypothetical protein